MEHLITFLNCKNKNQVDILLVTGDVYIDHPSFGIAIIARILEKHNYSICVVSQPEYYNKKYLDYLPDVKFFIGITSGNLDSVVSNYSSNRNIRKKDDFSIDGNPYFNNGLRKRPDLATIVYTSFLKQKYKNKPFVIGGLEASIRRFAHYDFIQQKLRKSILIDSKADILVYSMGEMAILEIAERIKNNKDLFGINGTMIKLKDLNIIKNINFIQLPEYNEILKNKSLLIKQTELIENNMVPDKSNSLVQKYDNDFVISFPLSRILTQKELDDIYDLPFQKNFPSYCDKVPAFEMIKNSITSHRGCYGKCSFCAIAIHQGPIIISRSKESIIKEVLKLTEKKYFKGTITDIGGPTANMYGSYCKINYCKNPSCLFPEVCKNLVLDQNIYIDILKTIKNLNKVKNVFVSSGIRHDIALIKQKETEEIIKNFTSGHLKIAPEHIDNNLLTLLRKPDNNYFIDFINFFNKIKKKYNLKFYILPYFILSLPGSSNKSTHNLGKFCNKYKIKTYQYQDFTPVPGTMLTAIYYSEIDLSNKKIFIPKISSLKNIQRKILEKYLKKN